MVGRRSWLLLKEGTFVSIGARVVACWLCLELHAGQNCFGAARIAGRRGGTTSWKLRRPASPVHQETALGDWSAYVINLDRRPDRLHKLQQLLRLGKQAEGLKECNESVAPTAVGEATGLVFLVLDA
eukprot:s1669_g1.t1